MNTDFRLSTGLFTHPKFVKLRRKVGAEGALSYLALLSFVAQNNPDGDLGAMDAEEIAIAGQYDGDADAFVAALVAVRLLDAPENPGDSYKVHDWEDHNPYAASAPERSNKAKVAANARWGKASNATQDAKQCSEHDLALPDASVSNAPTYLPNLPSPTKPTKPTNQQAARGAKASEKTNAVHDPDANGRLLVEKKELLEKFPWWEAALEKETPSEGVHNRLSYQSTIWRRWVANPEKAPPKPVPPPEPTEYDRKIQIAEEIRKANPRRPDERTDDYLLRIGGMIQQEHTRRSTAAPSPSHQPRSGGLPH